MLKDGGVVHAVDPSKENLKFGENIAQLNNISNINWVEGVCSDIVGIPLSFKGDIGHAEFSVSQKSSHTIMSTTLDKIIDKSNNKDISNTHIDVEDLNSSLAWR